MNKVSERINRLAESATLAMARMSRELKVLGKWEKFVNMWCGRRRPMQTYIDFQLETMIFFRFWYFA